MRATGWIGMGVAAALVAVVSATGTEDKSSASCHEPLPGGSGSLAFGGIETKASDWNRFLKHLDPKTSLARQIEAYRAKNGVPIGLVAPDDLGRLPPDLSRIEDHDAPCGPDIIVFSRSLGAPSLPGSGLLRGERVLEIDSEGRVVRKWIVPTSQWGVAAVRGSNIMVRSWAESLCRLGTGEERVHHDVWLDIKTDGSFRIVDPDPKMPEPVRAQCRLPEGFAGSAYAGCWHFKDLESGATRILVFDVPCT